MVDIFDFTLYNYWSYWDALEVLFSSKLHIDRSVWFLTSCNKIMRNEVNRTRPISEPIKFTVFVEYIIRNNVDTNYAQMFVTSFLPWKKYIFWHVCRELALPFLVYHEDLVLQLELPLISTCLRWNWHCITIEPRYETTACEASTDHRLYCPLEPSSE